MFEPGTMIEKYEIVREMGEGGMARVFEVKHTLLESRHALKVLSPELVADPGLRARFLDEGRIQARLRHPNIVAVTDVIAQPGVAALLMEFVDGPTLDDFILNRAAPPALTEVQDIFAQLLDGLGFAHGNGVIHRDIKPSNVVLATRHDGALCPKILDFGIAKLTGGFDGRKKGRTATGAAMGTLHYMSPEQIKGVVDLDARADIFSLAATLYEFITGELPFDTATDYDTMKQIVEGTPTPIRQLSPDVDPVLEACVNKGLARDREARFQSCAEFKTLLMEVGSTTATPRPIAPRPLPVEPAPHAIRPIVQSFEPPPPISSTRPAGPAPTASKAPGQPWYAKEQRSPHDDVPSGKLLPSDPPAPIVAALASGIFCFPGVGHLMLGQQAKGLVLIAASLVIAFGTAGTLSVPFSLFSAVDAYKQASKLKQGRAISEWETF